MRQESITQKIHRHLIPREKTKVLVSMQNLWYLQLSAHFEETSRVERN